MNTDTIRQLDELFEEMPVMVAGPASAAQIDFAERKLAATFPKDYRRFLELYGGAMVGSLPIFGVSQAEVMGDDTFSVVDVTARFRADGWSPTESWIVISMDLAGNPVGMTDDGEIWISDHDAGTVSRIARNFEEFVRQLLCR